MSEWENLSDDELAARLRQHGAGMDTFHLVAQRDEPDAAAAIDEVLS